MRRPRSARSRPTLALGAILLLAVPAGAAAQAVGAPTTPPSAEQQRLDQLTHEISSQLRCPVCQGLSIEESGSDIANEMRGVVREQLEAGRSPEEVKEFFVRAYGEWVLLQPRAEGFNLTIYILPVVVLLAGAALIVHLTRRWSRAPAAGATPPVVEDEVDLAPWTP